MITKKTVLVLGAGASMDYDFPSGNDLLVDVWRELPFSDPFGSALGKLLRDMKLDTGLIEKFAKELHRCGCMSVDEFLEHRPEFIQVGKLAMAYCLIPKENSHRLLQATTRKNSWYHYLWGRMRASFDELPGNQIRFVTFNYDRSLEFFLSEAVQSQYNKTPEEAEQVLRSFPIVHVHGQMGELNTGHGRGRAYNSERSEYRLKIAAEGITIIHESADDHPNVQQARLLIKSAEQVVFLGFGYHPVNVKRLNVSGVAPGENGKSVIGTCKGLSPEQFKYVANMIPN